MRKIARTNVETFGTLIVIGSIIFFTLLFVGTLQFLYLRRKNSAKLIKRRPFRYPLDYRMSCLAWKMRTEINERIPEIMMNLDIGCSGPAPYMSRHDTLHDQALPPSVANAIKYGFLTDDLTDEEYAYVQSEVQKSMAAHTTHPHSHKTTEQTK